MVKQWISALFGAILGVSRAQKSVSTIFTRNQLTMLKMKAIRAGVWFKALPRIDRVLVDLTISVAENIRSTQLANSIFSVVNRLESFLESRYVRFVRTVGQPLAEKASLIARSWGNTTAIIWANDRSFALYFAAMQANK